MKLASIYVALGMLLSVATGPADSRSGDDDNNNALPPFGHTFFCLRYPRDCVPMSSTRALPDSMDARWRKMNLVNTTVNAAIAPKTDSDEVHTHWLIAPLAGDCNDYSVTKRHELLKAGWPSSSLLLAEVTLISTGEHHLILIVTDAEANWVLDNLNRDIVTLAATGDEYALNRVESSENPQYWINPY
jgi:predicted transglutaminase-like cysteine proteinase